MPDIKLRGEEERRTWAAFAAGADSHYCTSTEAAIRADALMAQWRQRCYESVEAWKRGEPYGTLDCDDEP